MTTSNGFGCETIDLKKSLGVGTGNIRTALYNRLGENMKFWGHDSRRKCERMEGRRK